MLVLQQWYMGQMKMICDWLTDRLDLSLHPYQLTCLMTITRVRMHSSQISTCVLQPHQLTCLMTITRVYIVGLVQDSCN